MYTYHRGFCPCLVFDHANHQCVQVYDVVKDYHAYKIKPGVGDALRCEREPQYWKISPRSPRILPELRGWTLFIGMGVTEMVEVVGGMVSTGGIRSLRTKRKQ